MLAPDSLVWITGASKGLGRGLALACAKKTCRLLLSGRSVPLLEEVAHQCQTLGGKVDILPFDISDARKTEEVLSSLKDIPDIVINNAGVSQRALSFETDFPTVEYLTRVNYLAPVQITRFLLPHYLKQNRGTFMGISSIAAIAGIPLRSSYSAAKSALVRFYQTLMTETRNTGLHVCLVLPGFIRTEISCQALTEDGSPYGKMDRNQQQGMDPLKAGEYIIERISRPMIWVGISFRLYLLRLITSVAPKLAIPLLARNF